MIKIKSHWSSPCEVTRLRSWYLPPSCPCLCPGAAPPLQTACSPGCSPASPASAAAQHPANGWGKNQLLPLEPALRWQPGPYPHQGHLGANRLFFGCFSCVVHACWNLSPILLFSKAGSCKELHKTITFLLSFCVSPGLLSQKDEQGEVISSGEPFLLSKIIWERICYVTTLLLSCQLDTWEHSYQHGLEKFL